MEMEDKGNKIKINLNSRKLDWEAPVLLCLDKTKTDGGSSSATAEDIFHYPTMGS